MPLQPPIDLSQQWEKILWRRPPFPDNYVPDSFLKELQDLRESGR